MTIVGKINRLGGEHPAYPRDTLLYSGVYGDTALVNFKKGLYYIRGQGGGGGGGRNSFGNGGGGGSAAGFEGLVYLTKSCTLKVGAGVGGTQQVNGTDTYITGLMIMGGGGRGLENVIGIGGILNISPEVRVISSIISSNGTNGRMAQTDGGFISGAHSVLTNTGGGRGESSATAPGAGGGGGYQWHQSGGTGGGGELIIQYIKAKP